MHAPLELPHRVLGGLGLLPWSLEKSSSGSEQLGVISPRRRPACWFWDWKSLVMSGVQTTPSDPRYQNKLSSVLLSSLCLGGGCYDILDGARFFSGQEGVIFSEEWGNKLSMDSLSRKSEVGAPGLCHCVLNQRDPDFECFWSVEAGNRSHFFTFT